MSPWLIVTLAVTAALVVAISVAFLVRRQLQLRRERKARRDRGAPALHPDLRIRPIVLVHGVLGFDHVGLLGQRIVYFRGVAEMLRDRGVEVYTARLPKLSSVPDRARALAEFVRELPCEQVNIVAHSMGGLDSRYAISRLGIDDKVASLVTVATPHRGTPLADLLSDVAGILPMRALRSMVGRVGLETAAVDWLTTQRTGELNRAIENAGDVMYGSIVGRTKRSVLLSNPVLLSGYLYIAGRAGENDGMVPVASQYWGEVMEEIEADHWAQIGWSNYFDAVAVYRRLLQNLYRHGL
ncbi:MAG: alpha/beta fold hydrolase [Proteobacteria bacterium]|nr:alpha/beta fold hydrolase [Pseudomonadota bacterium]